jgi:hypothetical protein
MCCVKKCSTERSVAIEILAAEIVKEQSHMTVKRRKGPTEAGNYKQAP